MAACGQTMAHLPQSMQIDGSQIGISWAMARFSYCVVPVGNVPSTGKALTGSRSPSPAIRTAVTFLTKSGASSGTTATSGGSLPLDRAERHVGQPLEGAVDGREVALDDRLARAWRRSSRRSP